MVVTQNGEPVRPLSETPNWMIFDAIRNEASPLYQSRVPAATQGNVREAFEGRLEPPPGIPRPSPSSRLHRPCANVRRDAKEDPP